MATPATRFLRPWFLFTLWMGLALLAIGVGLRLTPWVAMKTGKIPLNFAILGPTADIEEKTRVWVNLIGASRSEIVIASEVIETKRVLEALKAAQERHVQVRILLSRDRNADPNRGGRGWLLNSNVGDVSVSMKPFNGTILVIDGAYVASSGGGISSAAASAAIGTFTIGVDRSALANSLREEILRLFQSASAPNRKNG